MKKSLLVFMMGTSLLATSCGGQKTTEALTSGINKEYLDTTVLPAEDFYQYACGGWMAKNPIKDEYARYGTFDQLRENNREQLKTLIGNIAAKTNKANTDEQKIGDLYNLGMDSTKAEQLGAKPIEEELKKIVALKGINELTGYLAEIALTGSTPFFGFSDEANPDNSKQCIAWVWQDGLGIGDRDYYLDAEMQPQRDAYVKYLITLMQLSGYNNMANIQNREDVAAKQVLAFETELAKAFMDKNTMRDPFITKNLKTLADLQKMLPVIDFEQYTKILGLNKLDTINVGQVKYIEQLNTIISTSDFNTIKNYLACRLIVGAAPYLSSDFVNANFEFYGKTLSGIKELKPRWKRVISTVESFLGEPVGEMYVKKYFPEESKKRMLDLVNNLKVALKERIAQNTWMADTTKQKSYEKLDAFIVKIGYPDKWRNFSGLKIDKAKSYYENVGEASKFEVAYRNSKIGKPVDPTEWQMTPQTVNAYYNPTTNEICFPAGILQPPFFDPKVDDAFNYGAIGVVIGHEMSHGFDDQGRNYDKTGNLNNWWIASDDSNFKERTQILVDWFNAIEVLPGTHANGVYTLGENIADNGGVNISFVAMHKAIKEGKITNTMDGFSADERFFIAYAQVWAGNVRDEETVRLTKEDPHSLGRWRVNGTLPHINAFAETYKLKDSDKMYLSPEKRAVIW
ncbi:MAG: M13 family metallopeptidase [Prevotellaceae bacterium]|jgi:putative endopeptidase|nr:M13 family metallopeptidase [Prevotellaceae bacterium]